MAQINEEQVLELIKMNARDFWTIADENFPRFVEFNNQEKAYGSVSMGREEFTSICITQFIELKRGSNFGSVKIHSKDDKKEEKPNPKPEEKEPKLGKIEDEDKPVLDSQVRTLQDAIQKHPQGENIKNQYLKDLNKESVRDLTRKECFTLIIVKLHIEKDNGGD